MARTPRLLPGRLGAALALALLIGACGGGDGGDDGSETPSGGGREGQVSFARGVSIATREVGGGQLDGVKRDDVGNRPAWKVTLDRGNVEHKVSVAVAGGKVLKHERQREAGGSTARTRSGEVGFERAVSIARREVRGGRLDEVERDDVGNRPAWKVTLVRGKVEHKVSVAIAGGKVLKHKRGPAGKGDGKGGG